jgi:polysaccharide deacetylase family protein (PEP-CTERM system associated)
VAANAFTVDVEDWFHICGVDDRLPPAQWHTLPSRIVDTTRWLLDDLASADVTASFFVVGWVAERFPDLVADILAAGHHVGAHSYWHRRTYELTPQTFADDLMRNRTVLAQAGAHVVTSFRAPEWSANARAPWASDVLRASGFTIDASRAPVPLVGSKSYPRRPYPIATSSGPLLEVPPFVVTRGRWAYPLGWGWALRSARPATVVREIGLRNRAGDPAVLTVHPWEIDPQPPSVRLPPRLAFAHYFRLSGFRARLREMLAGAEFGPVSQLSDARAWEASTSGTVAGA